MAVKSNTVKGQGSKWYDKGRETAVAGAVHPVNGAFGLAPCFYLTFKISGIGRQLCPLLEG